MDTLDHFIFLERPEGSATADSEVFAVPSTYKRIAPSRRAMPSSQDYLTVGGLYHGIRNGLDHFVATIGNGDLFCGAPEHQVGPGVRRYRAFAWWTVSRPPLSD
jgi:hypothetical protein